MNIKKIANTIFATVIVDISPKDFTKKRNTFSFELSDKDLAGAPHYIRLRNPKTKRVMDFEMYDKDYDASHEDIYGFKYRSTDGKYELLIIND